LDAQGKALGLPVSALLGGALQTSLPVLWTLASGDTARISPKGKGCWPKVAIRHLS
jgi:muconate cycloisomerase